MDFSKNIINKPKDPKPHKINRPMAKMPVHAGKKVGGSPERINTLTGMKVKEERKAGGGTKTMKAGSNTQVIRKPAKAPAKPKVDTKEEKNVIDYSKGKMIGKNTDYSKWRCKTCKFLNDIDDTQCSMCHEDKQVLTDKAVFGGANTKKRTTEKGAAVTKPNKAISKDESKEEGKSGKPGASNSSGFQSKVQTLGDYNYYHSSRAGEQKVSRIDETETTMSKLQKIAMNSDNLDTMP